MFSQLRVWDTQANNGVLIYLLLAEHAIEIVPDRDARTRIAAAEWQRITDLIAERMAANRYADAIVDAIQALTPLLATHYPCALVGQPAGDELEDRPTIL